MVTLNVGSPPVADSGGPYTFTEITGSASNGAWNIALDGTGSTDSDSSVQVYSWCLGEDTFDTIDVTKWRYGQDVTVGGALTVTQPGTGDGTHYLRSNDLYSRADGYYLQWKMMTSSSTTEATFGLRNTGTNSRWNEFYYGFRFYRGNLYIAESGSHINLSTPFTPGTWYEFRIVVHPSAGAAYYYREVGSPTWILIRETTSSNVTSFERGLEVYKGELAIDDLKEIVTGQTPTYRLYHAGTRVYIRGSYGPASYWLKPSRRPAPRLA